MYPMWGRPTPPPPEHPGKWAAGWRHKPGELDDFEQVFSHRLEAWIWLRTELTWRLDDHWTEELFRAAMNCACMPNEYIQKSEWLVLDVYYFLEPYVD